MKKYLLTSLMLVLIGGFRTVCAEVKYTYQKDTYNKTVVITGVTGVENETRLEIPEVDNQLWTVVGIGDWVFNDCVQLKEVVIPSSVKTIGEWAFCACQGLEKLELGAGVEQIGKGAFAYCPKLSLSVATGNTAYEMVGGVLYNKAGTELVWCDRTKAGTIKIKSGVKRIAAYAFYGCKKLTSVDIPSSVKAIGEWAFGECSGLTSLSLPDGLEEVGESAFSGCSGVGSLVVPSGVKAIGNWTFASMANLTSIKFSSSLVLLSDYAFDACEALTRVEFEGAPPACSDDQFDGLATTAEGIYHSQYATEWKSAMSSSGTWKGLKMTSVTSPRTSCTVVGYEGPYDGKAHTISISNLEPSAAKVSYAVSEDGPWSAAEISLTDVGSKTVYYRLAQTGYETTIGSSTITISPREVIVTSASATKKFDGEPLVAESVTISGDGFLSGDGGTAIFTGSQTKKGSSKNAFTYTLSSGTRAENYSITLVEGILTVTASSSSSSTSQHVAPSDEVAAADFSVARVYNGYLYDPVDSAPRGTIQVKTAKEKFNKKAQQTTSKITIVIQIVGEKKVTLSGEQDVREGTIEWVAKDGRELMLDIGADGLVGAFDAYEIDGVRDYFSSKDADEKADVTGVVNELKGMGAIVLAWGDEVGWNGLSLTVGAKGKTKVVGTLSSGTKVSASMQMIIGEEWCAIPVIVSKKGLQLAFTVWISRETGELLVVGFADGVDAKIGRAVGFTGSAAFQLDSAALAELLGDATYEEYFPTDMTITVKGTKWNLPKAGRVVLKNGVVDETKLLDNPAGLKLTYKVKEGTFTGSFKAYKDVKGKVKSETVNVTGVVIDGVGYGTATIRKVGSIPVQIEPVD